VSLCKGKVRDPEGGVRDEPCCHAACMCAETQLNTAANLFPRHIVEYLSTNKAVNAPEQMAQLARQHKDVTLLFMDIVGFTAMSKEVAPEAVMVFLNTLFAHFDALCDKHGEPAHGWSLHISAGANPVPKAPWLLVSRAFPMAQ
ncbi:guanylate cyclase domain-containing protein, partial [Haematococcus lacustris]